MAASTIEMVDLSKVLTRYTNCWVALSRDEKRVLASAKHPKEALRKAQIKGERDPILMWAPKEHTAYIV